MSTGEVWSRRGFLTTIAAVGAAGRGVQPAAAEPPPETTRLRLRRSPTVCLAPMYVAEELLRAEGFTDVQYPSRAEVGSPSEAVARGRVDVIVNVLLHHLIRIDAGDPVVALAGVHGGCYELVGSDRVRTLRDLKGKTIWGPPGEVDHLFIASMLAYVGLDPKRDVRWLTGESDDPKQLFLEGRTDAVLALRRTPRSCERGRSGTSSSIRLMTGHGPSSCAASCSPIVSSLAGTRSRPSAWCGRS
jgi:NitT/TauT family transport system substrate-binding protein